VKLAEPEPWAFELRTAVGVARLDVGGPINLVTSQVTTPPVEDRRSATQPDTDIFLTCGNPTQRDAIGRNRHAW
jgi:hypothetical protein